MNIYVRNKILEEKFRRIKDYIYEKGKNGEELLAYELLRIINENIPGEERNQRIEKRNRDFKKNK